MLRVSFFLLLHSFGWSSRKMFSSPNCDPVTSVGASVAFLCWTSQAAPFLSRFLFFPDLGIPDYCGPSRRN
jgi:hypothetical protein